MGKKIRNILGTFIFMFMLLLFAVEVHAYSGSAAVSFAQQHCASNHSQGSSYCPNNWQCSEFVANCLKAGGMDITPTALAGVRNFFNKMSTLGTASELTISSGGYIKNTGNNLNYSISPGDTVVTYCTKHNLYLHAVLVTSVSANGNIYEYAHNSTDINKILIASRGCSGLGGNESYSNIKAYVIHFNSTSTPTPSNYFAAAVGTDGSLAVNDKPASSSANLSTMLTAIPEGAVCTVYPAKANGAWQWVEYKGVQGYAYGKYLQTVTRTVTNGVETAHPHRLYHAYSNGYTEYMGETAQYTVTTVKANCLHVGYTKKQCTSCSWSKTEYDNSFVPTGHHFLIAVNAREATCTEDGYSGDIYCKYCGEFMGSGKIISKTNHQNTEIRNTKEATYTEEGYTGDVYCCDCGIKLSSGVVIEKKTNPKDTTKDPDQTPTENKPAQQPEEGQIQNPKQDQIQNPQVTQKAEQNTVKNSTDTSSKTAPGSIVKDYSTNGVYKVMYNKCVEYVKPAAKRTSVKIPDTVRINGITFKVTRIAANAFENNMALKSVTIGKNVTTIGVKAFYNCKKLKSITVKTSRLNAKRVGSKAFARTYSKAKVRVPAKKLKSYKKVFRARGISKKASYKK